MDDKNFIECAIQTDNGHSPLYISRPPPSAIVDHDEISSENASLVLKNSRRTLGIKSHLPFQKPSDARLPVKRITSLPETSPVTRVKGVPSDGLRTVSMSAAEQEQQHSTSLTEDSSLSFDYPESSVSLDASSSRFSAGSTRIRTSSGLSGLPHTPSPPSSPESVMIIGSDVQVPRTFFRQKHMRPEYNDNDGWADWSSSPPKPIPALHGPLSLPYARCPSGAEGTIIQGDDLSRMIWGLNEDSQPSHQSTNNVAPRKVVDAHKPNPSAPQQRSVPHSARQKYEDTSRPAIILTPQAHPPRPAMHETIGFRGPEFYLSPNAWDVQECAPGANDVGNVADLYDTMGRLSLGSRKPQTPLQPSAPAFIPASTQNSPQRSPLRILVEPRLYSRQRIHSNSREFPSALTSHDNNSALPTPPNSSALKWTPTLPQLPNVYPHIDYLPSPADEYTENFEQSHPIDSSDELRNFVLEYMVNLSQTDFTSALQLIADVSRSDRFEMPPSQSKHRGPANTVSSARPGAPLNSLPTDYRPSLYDAQNSRCSSIAYPPSPSSAEEPSIQSNVTARQPRSVPFARMMQRRLSSVPEEDANPDYEPRHRNVQPLTSRSYVLPTASQFPITHDTLKSPGSLAHSEEVRAWAPLTQQSGTAPRDPTGASVRPLHKAVRSGDRGSGGFKRDDKAAGRRAGIEPEVSDDGNGKGSWIKVKKGRTKGKRTGRSDTARSANEERHTPRFGDGAVAPPV